MLPVFAEVDNELEDIRLEVQSIAPSFEKFHEFASKATQSQEADDLAFLGTIKAGIASRIDNAYTGIEKCIEDLLYEWDGEIPKGDDWHKKLLIRAAATINDRPAILGQDTFSVLNELRSFRHFERNLYSKVLNEDELARNAERAKQAFELFNRDIVRLKQLFNQDSDSGSDMR
jgi:hypothetical protein